ncbi:MAG: hypothetical protein C5B59_06100 [Bacteroidetes bacterium]|nr:MAG: hypothetical protein C5B59_06100 [Bacteroidota bacterium]
MKEYMLLIRNNADIKDQMTPDQQREFLNECMVYIEKLKKNGNLKSAQPLVREGVMVSGTPEAWKDGPYTETKEVIVGYYHILAKDLKDAISIAKGNPEFAYTKTAKVEVRPIKMVEEATAYTYPK